MFFFRGKDDHISQIQSSHFLFSSRDPVWHTQRLSPALLCIHKSEVTPCSHLIFLPDSPHCSKPSLIPSKSSFPACLCLSLLSEPYSLKAAAGFPFYLHVASGYCSVSCLCFKTEHAHRLSSLVPPPTPAASTTNINILGLFLVPFEGRHLQG